MSVIRLLNNGTWDKPPVLTAARRILMDGLSDSWPKAALGDLATFVNGTSYDRGLLAESGTPIIRISNISDPQSEYLTTNQEFVDKYIVRPDDLLVSWSASFKSIIWPGPTGVLNQHIFKVTEKPGNHRGFLRHAIEAVFDDLRSKVVGIGMMHLRRNDFLGHPVPAPNRETQEVVCRFLDWIEKPNGQSEPLLPTDLSRQRSILARIEELTARIEEARGLRRQTVEEAEALLGSEEMRVWSDDTLENAPSLSEVTDFLSRGRQSRQGESDHYLIKTQHVQMGKYVKSDMMLASDVAPKVRDEATVRQGDILIACSAAGCLGRVAHYMDVGRTASTDTHVAIARASQNRVSDEYLYKYPKGAQGQIQLRSREQGDWKREKVGFRLTELNLADLKRVPIPLPPFDEQQRIVAYLDDLQAKVDSLKRLQTETAAELDALLPSVLDQAFKGKL